MTYTLHHGDCLDILKGLPDGCMDSVVTDPPYGLSDHSPQDTVDCLRAWLDGREYRPRKNGFMGHAWDAWVPGPEVWRECLRVLKPGGHLLAFAGTRSMDLMGLAVRLAGFELRDSIGWANDPGDPLQAPLLAWTFGSGFPKSADVSKAIDRAAGAEREVVGYIDTRGQYDGISRTSEALNTGWRHAENREDIRDLSQKSVTAPATAAARQWQGWGTALKPAWEPVILARKPLIGTVAANILAHGVGGLNIDACRVPTTDVLRKGAGGIPCRHDEAVPRSPNKRGSEKSALSRYPDNGGTNFAMTPGPRGGDEMGRWPANLILQDTPAVLSVFPDAPGQQAQVSSGQSTRVNVYGQPSDTGKHYPPRSETDASAARFFHRFGPEEEDIAACRMLYCAKASRTDRDEGLNATGAHNKARVRKNHHATVKPTPLMRHLVRLVTPPGGTVLDPFMGSGSTGKACMLEGAHFVGIEREAEYLSIAQGRIEHASQGGRSAPARSSKPSTKPAQDSPQRSLFGLDEAVATG